MHELLTLLYEVNFWDYGAGMCHKELGRYTVVTMDHGTCLSSKLISEVLRVLELQIGRDEIAEVKSGNEMLKSLRLVWAKDDHLDQ